MGARSTVRSFSLTNGEPGMFFWPGRRNRAFDVVAIVLGYVHTAGRRRLRGEGSRTPTDAPRGRG